MRRTRTSKGSLQGSPETEAILPIATNQGRKFRVLAVNQGEGKAVDPTHTKTLRQQYMAEMWNRFRTVKGLIRQTIVQHDALRLKPGVNLAYPITDFGAFSDREKIEAFQDWLDSVNDDEVLEVVRREGKRAVARHPWQNTYIRRAYQKGVYHANANMRSQGVPISGEAAEIMRAPIHAETLGLLYNWNFAELDGITADMERQIHRELVDGFAKGYNPNKMATKINERVGVALTRARTLARTAVVKTHADASLNRYSQLGVKEVKPVVELATANDERVCEICAGLAGQAYTLDEARGIIPLHPNCRCSWEPVVESFFVR